MKSINSSRRWQVHYRSEARAFRCNWPRLRALLQAILQELDACLPAERRAPETVRELSLLLCADATIQELNAQYRGKDKPTDVLSFSQLEGDAAFASSLGDLVISLEVAQRQSKRYRLSLSEELLRLLVHGLLHLHGYDHEKVAPAKAQAMRRMERRIFTKFRGQARGLVQRKAGKVSAKK
jgi:probable rRNA maturation factor